MFLMYVLCLAIALGVVGIWRWGNLEVQPPWKDEDGAQIEPFPPSMGTIFRRYVWYVTVTIGAGVVSGVVMLGGGGRLVMRLLAATAGDEAQGRVTEADEVVGVITTDGSIGFIIFVGIFGGLLMSGLYMVTRRWLPRGRWGGAVYGAVILIAIGTRIDPLRPDNVDFNIVGPGWLAVLAFSAILIGYGMLLATLAGRYSRALPLISKDVKTVAKHAPLLLLVPAFGLLIPLTGAGLLGLWFSRAKGVDDLLTSPGYLRGGRIAAAVLTAIALPGFVIGIVDIATRPS
ncbi:MAG TPA: hypothetical protein VNC78_05140 [Actinomycetota bacterium]|nr:hypothetical protein [Actinomycetota bacterium]